MFVVCSICGLTTTGYVSIRSEPYEGTTIIGKIPDGRIAGVVEPGGTFT